MTNSESNGAPLPTSTGVLAQITDQISELRRSERRVAEVVLENPESVLGMSLARLSATAGVSDPTVMRFCAALGYEGFQAFRIALAQSLAFGVPATNSAISRGDSSATIIDKIFSYTLSSLDHTRRTLDTSSVVAAIELITTARTLVFVGHGASQIIAQDAAQKFPLFGVPCMAPSDSHQQHMMASMASPGDVYTAISNTGRTASIINVARTAQANGALVIGITGGPSPLAEVADVALLVETHENTDLFTPTISRIAALILIDVLSTGVALLRSEQDVRRVQAMKASLADMREGML